MKKCTIIIFDEVNCKIENLELKDRKTLSKMFEHEKPGARYLPSVRLGRWNGKTSYFGLGGTTFVNLLTEIIPLLDQAGYEIDLDDRRKHSHTFEFAQITEDSFSNKVWPKKHPLEGQPIKLRDYQVDIINTLLSNTQSMTVAATGSGKTIVTAALSHSVESYGRTIVIVPNQSLVTQTEADYINLGLDVGVYFGNRKEYNKQHTICTWQSLNSLKKTSKEKDLDITIEDFIEGVICVIVDECFHEDSLVLTVNGYVPIKNIKPGDKIINFSEDGKVFKTDTVIDVHINLSKSSSEKMYELEFDTGQKIKVTGNHKFLTNKGWCRADELTETHEILSSNINT